MESRHASFHGRPGADRERVFVAPLREFVLRRTSLKPRCLLSLRRQPLSRSDLVSGGLAAEHRDDLLGSKKGGHEKCPGKGGLPDWPDQTIGSSPAMQEGTYGDFYARPFELDRDRQD